MRGIIGLGLVLAIGLSGPLAAQKKSQTIQCWTDDKGQRMCGDRVPPEYADKQREVINQRGIVIETKQGAKTPEQLAEEQRKAQQAEEERKARDYDRYLLESYRTVKDIRTMRDERLALLDSRIKSTEKSLADNEKALADLRGRAAAQDKDGKPVNEKLAKQIRQYEKSLTENQESLARLQKERSDVETRFNGDLKRFSELRGIKPAPEPKPTPTAESGTKPGG